MKYIKQIASSVALTLLLLCLLTACFADSSQNADAKVTEQSQNTDVEEAGQHQNNVEEKPDVNSDKYGEDLSRYKPYDFARNENWAVAYPYFKDIGKPINQIVEDYSALQYYSEFDGGSFFIDDERKILYGFPLEVFDGSDYTVLSGDKICNDIMSGASILFPDFDFPSNTSDVLSCLEEYLGIHFLKDDSLGEYYFSNLFGNRLYISVERTYDKDGSFNDAEVIFRYLTDEWMERFLKSPLPEE
jgi:hypothetical protein